MSWVDLAALTFVLWGAVRGYLYGVYHTFLQLCGIAAALAFAIWSYRPLAQFLHNEWGADAHIVGLLARTNEGLLETTAPSPIRTPLPPLAGRVMSWLVQEEAVILPAGASDISLKVLSLMLLRFAALGLFFLFVVAVIALLLRIQRYSFREQKIPEWQRLLGLALGVLHGLFIAMVICISLDAVAMVAIPGLLQPDINHSYVSVLTSFCLQMFL